MLWDFPGTSPRLSIVTVQTIYCDAYELTLLVMTVFEQVLLTALVLIAVFLCIVARPLSSKEIQELTKRNKLAVAACPNLTAAELGKTVKVIAKCPYPPKRSNRNRETCQMKEVVLQKEEKYCYHIPDIKGSVDCNTIDVTMCSCHFDSDILDFRYCYLYKIGM